MDSSNVRALWEARTNPELANLTLKPKNLRNERKHSDVGPANDKQKLRIGSSRKTNAKSVDKLSGFGKFSTDMQDLDDILLSLHDANDDEFMEDVKKTENISFLKDTETKTEILNNLDVNTKVDENIEDDSPTKEHTKKNPHSIQNNKVDLAPKVTRIDTPANGLGEETSIESGHVKPTEDTKPKLFLKGSKSMEDVKQNYLSKGSKSIDSKSTIENEKSNVTNVGENILASALQSLRSATNGSIKENNHIEDLENCVESPVSPGLQAEVVLRTIDQTETETETETETAHIKRLSARLSLHNSLEIVPEDKPIEIKHEGKKDEEYEFTNLIENIKKCNDLESLKLACIHSFTVLNQTLVETKSYMRDKEEKNIQVASSPPVTWAPPPPPPPGPPPPLVNANKVVLVKTKKNPMAVTAIAAVGTNSLMDEIKKKQRTRNQRKSLRVKYDTLDNN
eukprot:GFUD01015850.1.p1 GENE.GFUD01015850.1~~GFUD01015850.1.p1  ORF type:complete len:453 (+),score=133.99 GFUD01015850.1:69-1427(+)